MVFLLLMIAGIFIQPLFPLVFGFVIVVMVNEYHNITIGKLFPLERFLVILSSLLLFLTIYFVKRSVMDVKFVSIAAIPVIISFVSILYNSVKDSNPEDSQNKKIEDLFFPIIYIAAPFTSAIFLEYSNSGFTPLFLLAVFIIIWANDVGAYIFGMGFGQRPNSKKFAPKLSPKKSWWGFWGGCILSTVVSLLIGLFMFNGIHIVHCIVVGVIIGVFSIFGDLFESLLKRRSGVKDSGHIMPGHGGFLDRFDSMLLVMPMVTIYLLLAGII